MQENLNYLLSVKNLFINYLDQIASCKPEEKKEEDKKRTSQSDENDSDDGDSEEQKEECAFVSHSLQRLFSIVIFSLVVVLYAE